MAEVLNVAKRIALRVADRARAFTACSLPQQSAMLPPRLHLVMANKRSLIIELFVSEVRLFRLAPAHLQNAAIAQPLSGYLDAIIAALAEDKRESTEVLTAATDHAKQRARLGYDLRALLTEFGILRSTIIEVASQTSGFSVDEWERLGDILHESMAEAVVYLVDAQQKPAPTMSTSSNGSASSASAGLMVSSLEEAMSMKPR